MIVNQLGRPLLILLMALSLLVLPGCLSADDANPGRTLKIAFGSCIKYPNSTIWRSIEKSNPDLLLLLGDNFYILDEDLGRSERLRDHYLALQGNPYFAGLARKVPVYAIWDDHDFGPNNSDGRFEHAQLSLKLFREHWTKPRVPYKTKDGIARAITIGHVRLLLTDNRSFRINPSGVAEPQMFGSEQAEWIVEELRHPKAPVVVIASGGQLLAAPGDSEHFHDYPNERRVFLKAALSSPARVLVLSGDRHYAEILRVPTSTGELVEATASPLSAGLADLSKVQREEHRMVLYLDSVNFGTVEISPQGDFRLGIHNKSGERVAEYLSKNKVKG